MKLGDADWRADPKVLAHFGDVLDATELRRMRGATSSIWPFFGSRLFKIENVPAHCAVRHSTVLYAAFDCAVQLYSCRVSVDCAVQLSSLYYVLNYVVQLSTALYSCRLCCTALESNRSQGAHHVGVKGKGEAELHTSVCWSGHWTTVDCQVMIVYFTAAI